MGKENVREVKMKVSGVLIVLCAAQIGCSSSKVVSSSPDARISFSDFNRVSKEGSATIVFRDGLTRSVEEVIVDADTISFFDMEENRRLRVATHYIKSVFYTDRARGIMEGAGIGVLAGGGAGFLYALVLPDEGFPIERIKYFIFPAIGGAVGLVVGFMGGAVVGHTEEFVFER